MMGAMVKRHNCTVTTLHKGVEMKMIIRME